MFNSIEEWRNGIPSVTATGGVWRPYLHKFDQVPEPEKTPEPGPRVTKTNVPDSGGVYASAANISEKFRKAASRLQEEAGITFRPTIVTE